MKGCKYCEELKTLMNAKDFLADGTLVFCSETDRIYVKIQDDVVGITPKKRERTKFKCKNCGCIIFGSGSVVKCDYCGSVYDVDNWSNDVE